MGHHHRWVVIGSSGLIQWGAEGLLVLTSEDRYLVVVAAVYDGWYSIFDTESRALIPFRFAVY